MKSLIMLVVLGMLGANLARADVITEFGAGVKIPASTSLVMQEKCHEVTVIETRPPDPSVYRVASCGGDNPIFIGWPVAWQKDLGVWTIRAGWFHLSHWFDGGEDRELHMDCGCFTATFNWTEWRKVRRARRN